MNVVYMLVKDGISVQGFDSMDGAKMTAKEWEEYHGDGRKYEIEVRKTPETIRDVIDLCGIASKDRKLTVNGKPFLIEKNDVGINLVEIKGYEAA